MSRACHSQSAWHIPHTRANFWDKSNLDAIVAAFKVRLDWNLFLHHCHFHWQKIVESRSGSVSDQLPAPDSPRCIFVVEVEIKVVHQAFLECTSQLGRVFVLECCFTSPDSIPWAPHFLEECRYWDPTQLLTGPALYGNTMPMTRCSAQLALAENPFLSFCD